MQNKVNDLSSCSLTVVEQRVLSNGLNFVPVSFYDPVQIWADLYFMYNLLKLKVIFEDSSWDQNPFKPRSQFCQRMNDPCMLAFGRVLLRHMEIVENLNKCKFSNLASREHCALKDLKQDSSIIIKQADKSAAIDILDQSDYNWDMPVTGYLIL